MDLKKILNITGKPGLYELQKERGNGLIVKSLVNGRNQFVSMQKHGFSVLETIEVYSNDGEAVSLPDVFRLMFKMDEAGTGTPDLKDSSDAELRSYFTEVFPTHSKSKVYTNHIKKMIKWYDLLKEHNLVDLEIPEAVEEPSVEEDGVSEEE